MFSLFRRGRTPTTSPGNPDFATQMKRGNDALASGEHDVALDAYRRCVEAAPTRAEGHVNLGFALQALGRAAESEPFLRKAVALDGSNVDAYYLLGKALAAQGNPQAAITAFDRATSLQPGLAFAYADCARAHFALGQQGAARDALVRLAAADRESAGQVAVELGEQAVAQGAPEAALAFLDVSGPAAAGWAAVQGTALAALDRTDEAIVVLDSRIASDPVDDAAINARASILFRLGRYRDVIADCERILARHPDAAPILVNCASAWNRLRQPERAHALLQQALAIDPDNVDAACNLAVCLIDLGRPQEALESLVAPLARHPGNANLHWNNAIAHLMLGEFDAGWREHEWRWDAPSLSIRENRFVTDKPLWKGEPLEGRTILLTAEQGFGDTIQFARYVPLVAQAGGRVVLRVQRTMEPLFATPLARWTLSRHGTPLPPFDLYCPLMSLPLAFATRLDTIPADVPYLFAPARPQGGRPDGGPPRVGIVWAGNPRHVNDANRSIPLRLLLEVLPVGVEVVALQRDLREGDAELLQERGVRWAGQELHSFDETAAFVDALDVVVTVDTSVAHLAGAMAKPVWVLLPFVPDWRWLLDRSDSPWYPTARLFRQDASRDWAPVLARVRDELEGLARATARASA